MAPSNLKTTLQTAGLTAEQFAEIIGVDPKTVQRWVAGRTPYPRHRATVARALDTSEHELWPDDVPPPSPSLDPLGHDLAARGEVIRSWGQSSDRHAPNPVMFVSGTAGRIDVLDGGSGVLRTPGLVDALGERAADSGQVRVLADAPTGELGPLIGRDGIEVRVGDARPAHALVRVGDAMLVALAVAGESSPPLLQLHRRADGGLFDRLADHFAALWDAAGSLTDPESVSGSWRDDAQNARGGDGASAARSPGSPGSAHAEAPVSSSREGNAPRRWPRPTS